MEKGPKKLFFRKMGLIHKVRPPCFCAGHKMQKTYPGRRIKPETYKFFSLPPSTGKFTPVMYAAWGEAKNVMAAANSSG